MGYSDRFIQAGFIIQAIIICVLIIWLFAEGIKNSRIQLADDCIPVQEKQTAIIKYHGEYYTEEMARIGTEWFIMGDGQVPEGRFRKLFPGGKIVQVKDPQTGNFQPVKKQAP